MNEEWSASECSLKGGEGFSGSWGPGQRLGIASKEVRNRAGDSAVIPYETAVEISEAQKALEFFDGGGYWPG